MRVKVCGIASSAFVYIIYILARLLLIFVELVRKALWSEMAWYQTPLAVIAAPLVRLCYEYKIKRYGDYWYLR